MAVLRFGSRRFHPQAQVVKLRDLFSRQLAIPARRASKGGYGHNTFPRLHFRLVASAQLKRRKALSGGAAETQPLDREHACTRLRLGGQDSPGAFRQAGADGGDCTSW
jgi:hypothetical protein